MLAGIGQLSRAVGYNIMKTQNTIPKIFPHAIAAVIAIAAASPLQAADPLAVFADFNNDGRVDMAVVTGPSTITVSLANQDNSYTVSAILSVPKNRQITSMGLSDRDGDGDLDLYASSSAGGGWVYTYMWSGNGDGTFGTMTSGKWAWPPKGHFGSF